MTSAPSATHTRLNGRLPTVVKGATYSFPRRSNFFDEIFLASRGPSSPSIPPRVTPPVLGAGVLGSTSHARLAFTFSTCWYDRHFTGTSMRRRMASDLGIGYAFLAKSRWIVSGNSLSSRIGTVERYEPSFGCAPVAIGADGAVTSASRVHVCGFCDARGSSGFDVAYFFGSPWDFEKRHLKPYGQSDPPLANGHGPGRSAGLCFIHVSTSWTRLHASPWGHVAPTERWRHRSAASLSAFSIRCARRLLPVRCLSCAPAPAVPVCVCPVRLS